MSQHILIDIAERASIFARAGKTPRVVQLGQREFAALHQTGFAGYPGQTLKVNITLKPGGGFRTLGEEFPRASEYLADLRVETVEQDSLLAITEG